MKNILALLFTFCTFICEAQHTFFKLNSNYVAPSLAVLTSTSASSIGSNSAISGGIISKDGGSYVISRGVVWSTSESPTIESSSKTFDGSGIGSFTSSITGLASSTTYYIRAYAINSVGTSYGAQTSFTTSGPVGATISATNGLSYLTSTTGQSGGVITSDSGNTITAKGVVWSTSTGPTVALSTKTNDGTGVGAFTSTLTGLTLNTVYYIRSYATNSVGTSYGPEVSFAFIPTVTSGQGRIWMDRNLGATQAATLSNESSSFGDLYQWGRAADGHQLINSITTPTPSTSTTAANGYFVVGVSQRDWLSTSNNNLWQGVNGINNPCPKGFRIPTIQEWVDEKATWNPQNASGALASPLKLPQTQKFRNFTDGAQLNNDTYYWSSTIENVTSVLYYDKKSYVLKLSSLSIPSFERSYGFSCRCIQNY